MGKISKRQRQKNLEPHFCMEDADSTNDKNNNIPSPPESNPSPTSPACSSTPNNSSPMTLSPELSFVYHPYAHHHHHSSVSQRFPDPALINQVISELDPETRNKIDKQITLPLEELIRPTLKSRKGNIPRPQNLFVIYRKDLQAKLVLKHGPDVGSNLALVSKRASKSWERESQSIREIFEVIAELAKKVHERIYPGYVYKPKKRLLKSAMKNLDEFILQDDKFYESNGDGDDVIGDKVNAKNMIVDGEEIGIRNK
ncbi:15074_t:CDS:2 [Entrophospora sp. SA101]|nr:15074_t:CDS:2 [Entrophospora sp. SA101]